MIVPTAVPSAIVPFVGLERMTKKLSSGSTVVSPKMETVMNFCTSPAKKTRLLAMGAKSLLASAELLNVA